MAPFPGAHPQNRHHGRCAGGGESASPPSDTGELRDSTPCTPPHNGQNAVNILVWPSRGEFGNTTRIRSEGASNSSENPHLRQGWMTHAPRSPRYLSVTMTGNSAPSATTNLISLP